MAAKDCLNAKAAAGLVNKEKAAAVGDMIDDLEAEYQGSLGSNALSQAETDALISVRRQVKDRKRRQLKQVKAQITIRDKAIQHPGRVRGAMMAFLSMDTAGRFGVESAGSMRRVIRARAQSLLSDFFSEFRPKTAGLRRRTAGLDHMVFELFGKSTGDGEAKSFARAVSETMEYLRKEFNQAGGSIPKRENWGLPQHHDRGLVAAVSQEEWIDFTFQRLNAEDMIDMTTGLAMSEERLRRTLSEVYRNIVTGGAGDVAPGQQIFRKSLAARRQEHRFLQFDGPEKWLEYQERFGGLDPFNIVIGHIDGMARDIAMMNVLGPNPSSTLRFMQALIDAETGEAAIRGVGKKAARAALKIGAKDTALVDTFNYISGALEHSPNPGVADFLQGTRNILSASMLGGAFLLSIADIGFSQITSRMTGLPYMRVLKNQLRMMAPTRGTLETQRQAVRLGFGAQGWSDRALGAQRYIGEVIGPEWTGRIADTMMRLSLLTPWTQAGRWVNMTEMAGFLTEMSVHSFDELPDVVRQGFGRHGVTASHWELFRKTEKWIDPETGADFIRPMDMITRLEESTADTPLFNQVREAADKFQTMIMDESEFAIPSITDRVSAFRTGGAPPGTFRGELFRNALLFKSFPMTIMQTHMIRGATLNGGINKAKYFVHLFLATAAMGTFAAQMKQIVAGKDPASMDPTTVEGRKFLLKGIMSGGGLGLYGDFLFGEMDRHGQGLLGSLAGPVFGSVLPKLSALTVGAVGALTIKGEARHLGRKLSRFVELMTPGRSLWYTRLATDRLIFDELDKLLDPEAATAFQAIETRARSQTGQRYFSRPGRGDITKLPDIPAAIGIRRAPNLDEAFGR